MKTTITLALVLLFAVTIVGVAALATLVPSVVAVALWLVVVPCHGYMMVDTLHDLWSVETY